MGLRITHLAGPFKGQVQDFDLSKRTVTIGRDPECDIAFPEDFDALSSHIHCEIVKDASAYELRVDTRYRVLVNGKPALDSWELVSGDEVALGPDKDVVLQVEETRERVMPKTAYQGPRQRDASYLITQSRTRIVQMSLVLIVAIIGLGAAYQWLWQTDSRLDNITEHVARSKGAPDLQEAIRSSEESIYLVSIIGEDGKESPVGTAWVTEGGRLATNAHVAESIEDYVGTFQRDVKAVVRKGSPPFTTHNISDIDLHPAYRPFMRTWEEYGPMLIGADQVATRYQIIPGYDVALLSVTSPFLLGPPLPLASAADMEQLNRGSPIAFLGFPMENLVNFDPKKPIFNTQSGIITAITDFFRGASFDNSGDLIQHSLPSTGGASGSPIINSDGRVVALLSAGNYFSVDGNQTRILNAANINFGQRVDLLKDLFEPENIDLDALQTEWQAALVSFDNTRTVLNIERVAADWAKEFGNGKTPMTIAETEQNLVAEGVGVEHEIRLSGRGQYLVIAESVTGRDIDLVLANRRMSVYDQEYVVGEDTALDHVPYLKFFASPGTLFSYTVDAGLEDDLADNPSIVSRANFRVFFLPE